VSTHAERIAAVRKLAPAVAAHRAALDAERRLPAPLARTLADAGLFRLWLPRAFSGPELSVRDFIDVVSEAARLDGSVGWNIAVGATYSRFAGYLSPEVAGEIFAEPRGVVAGSVNPTGRAERVDGGWRVNGRWSYGSGIHQSTWVFGNCVTESGDVLSCFVPARAVEVIDNWRVGGLRGTGSCDYVIRDAIVSERFTLRAFDARPTQPGTLYAMPLITVFATAIAAVPLGIARAAIDEVVDLASKKTPTGSKALLRDREAAQAQVGRAESLVRASRAFLRESVDELADIVERTGEASMHARALVRLACANATEQGAAAVRLMFDAAGATANFESSPLERCLRDVLAASQHIALVANNYVLGGRVLLGLEPGTARF
jgi:alkylation response protein AidB-like acyl-CoA dehydrogenase